MENKSLTLVDAIFMFKTLRLVKLFSVAFKFGLIGH